MAIVEGHGEVEAVPILLRRIAAQIDPGEHLEVPRPIRTKRQRLVKPGELEKSVELAGRQTGPDDGILVLLDADSDCPRDLGPSLLNRAVATRRDRAISVVLAKAEYEAWFLAAAQSLAGRRGLDPAIVSPPDPEAIGDAKGWLRNRMPARKPYSETLDQPALTTVFDLNAARTAPSFEKLWREVRFLLGRR